MSLANPIPVTDFWDLLRPGEVTVMDSEPQRIDRTAGGAVLKASLGDRLWQGSVSAYVDTDYTRGLALEAKLSVASGAGMFVMAYDPRRTYPADDPDGSKLGSDNPTIWTVPDNRSLRLENLPENYVLTAGDLIGLSYGSNPVKYSLHRIVGGSTASNGSAQGFGTGIIEVTPFLPPEAISGVAVSLIKPQFKAIVLDANYGGGTPGRVTGPSFSFIQTLR